MASTTTNIWTKEDIKIKLQTSDAWLLRGLMAIYDYQTSQERSTMTTQEDNGVGFNGVDAFILSKFAEDYKKYNSLSVKQTALARRKMVKYAGQLARIAKEKSK